MRLETERLVLREFTIDDVPELFALESLPEVVRYQDYPPRTPDEAEQVVREIVKGQTENPRRHVELAVERDGRFIGRVGAWVEDTASLWYAFMPAEQGKGYATEAMRSLIDTIDVDRFTIECDPRNEPSWRLAERLGFKRESHTERAYESKGEWVGSFVYGRRGAIG
jgi:RimJ/RimL family protein N-acetyltransferase